MIQDGGNGGTVDGPLGFVRLEACECLGVKELRRAILGGSNEEAPVL